MSRRVAVKGVIQMQGLAQEIAPQLAGGHVLLLSGELGAGKTTFTQALAAALGVVEPITSPTFTIVSEYELPHPPLKKFIHVDLYRFTALPGQHDPLIAEVLEQSKQPDRITVIEWADTLEPHQFPATWALTFAHSTRENERVVTVTAPA